jgi:hypothetical protein
MNSQEPHVLKIQFAGICTHFRFGVVPGVPHRVVLPDAVNFLTGFLNVTDVGPGSGPVLYYLLPHFAQLDVAGHHAAKLYVPPLLPHGGPVLRNGDVLSGIRLQVLNAIDREMVYLDEGAPKLTDYDPRYRFSTDVVLEGRAACYFDLYGGTVQTCIVKGGASQTIVQVRTDGPPLLLVTALGAPNASTAPRSYTLPLPLAEGATEVTLTVSNLEAAIEEDANIDFEGGAFDFLLHYLTARGGIPQNIRTVTPGLLPTQLVSASPEDLTSALNALASLIGPPDPASRRRLITADEATPSCADSQYP